MPTPGATKTTNMHADAAMDMEKLFGVYGGVICLPVLLVVSGSPDVSNSFVSPYSDSFVCHCDWWCLALRMFPIHLSPLIAIHLSPSLAGSVRLPGYLQLMCLPFLQFICLPVWLVVSGSLHVSNSFVSPYSNSFVSESGWWCLALHLSPLLAINLSPSLAGGVRDDSN